MLCPFTSDIFIEISKHLNESTKISLSWTSKSMTSISTEKQEGYANACAYDGSIELLQHFISRKCVVTPDTYAYASLGGKLEVLKLLNDNYSWNMNGFRGATKRGFLDVIEWIGTKKCGMDSRVCTLAARSNRLDILIFARENNCPWTFDVLYQAAFNGHFKILDWSLSNNIESCKRISNNNCSVIDGAIIFAAYAGRKDVIKWLISKGGQLTSPVFAFAAKGGHLSLLIWLRKKNCPYNELTCVYAAQHGNLNILKYARDNGCSWDYTVPFVAALFGYVDILQYCKDNQCPINSLTWAGGQQGGFPNVIEWLTNNNCPQVSIDTICECSHKLEHYELQTMATELQIPTLIQKDCKQFDNPNYIDIMRAIGSSAQFMAYVDVSAIFSIICQNTVNDILSIK